MNTNLSSFSFILTRLFTWYHFRVVVGSCQGGPHDFGLAYWSLQGRTRVVNTETWDRVSDLHLGGPFLYWNQFRKRRRLRRRLPRLSTSDRWLSWGSVSRSGRNFPLDLSSNVPGWCLGIRGDVCLLLGLSSRNKWNFVPAIVTFGLTSYREEWRRRCFSGRDDFVET